MTFVETIKIENGIIHNLDFHQERMCRTALFHFGTKPEIRIETTSIPPHLQNDRIKCRVLYASDILSVEFHAYQPKKIQSLQTVTNNEIDYTHKSTDRNALNRLFDQRRGADDIIIVKNGQISDSSFANLVFETHTGELFTPKNPLLAGTKRAFLLKNGIIQEREIRVEDLPAYKKLYLINAMLDLEDNISVLVDAIAF